MPSVELDDEQLDKVIKTVLEDSLEMYYVALEEGYPMKHSDPVKDKKFIKKQIKAYKRILEDYQYV
jgi:hypothetical protein